MNVIFLIRINISKEIRPSVFIPQWMIFMCVSFYFIMNRRDRKDWRGWWKACRKAAKTLDGIHCFLICTVLRGFKNPTLHRGYRCISCACVNCWTLTLPPPGSSQWVKVGQQPSKKSVKFPSRISLLHTFHFPPCIGGPWEDPAPPYWQLFCRTIRGHVFHEDSVIYQDASAEDAAGLDLPLRRDSEGENSVGGVLWNCQGLSCAHYLDKNQSEVNKDEENVTCVFVVACLNAVLHRRLALELTAAGPFLSFSVRIRFQEVSLLRYFFSRVQAFEST